MIKYILVLIGLIGINAVAQSYQSLIYSDTTSWSVYECAPDAGGTYKYVSYRDTVIDTIQYTIINVYFSRFHDPGYYYGNIFLREDTLSGKAWIMKFKGGNPSEALYMDLSLTKGDKFKSNLFTGDSAIVDTVYYENSRKIIELNTTHTDFISNYKLKFIEGIGSTDGFYIITEEFSDRFSLLCKQHNNELVFETTADINQNCFREGSAAIDEVTTNQKFNVYPNPSDGNISICMSNWDGGEYNLRVYNTSGLCIMKKIIENYITKLNINNQGIYYCIISNSKEHFVKKLVINY